MSGSESPATARELVPMDAQLSTDGARHDLAPASERLKLFEPAPIQLAGQTSLTLDEHGAGTKEGNDETP